MRDTIRDRIVIFLIISNEFCERYTFYSIKSILFPFILKYYNFSPKETAWIVHSFVFSCYFFSVIGGMLADSFIGRYGTILYFNIIYAIGNVFLCLCSINTRLSFLITGLVLVAIGTGGIKPCVSAFGGDQAKNARGMSIELFFNMFYFFINTGSLIGILASPILASKRCFENSDCYLYAFQAATFLHLVSLVLFLIGSKFYHKKSPDRKAFKSIMLSFKSILKVDEGIKRLYRTLCTHESKKYGRAVHKDGNAFIKNLYKKERDSQHEGAFVREDVLKTLHLLKIFFFVSFFWMLFDQQSSFWIEQGMKMKLDTDVFFWRLKVLPSQMQAVNSIAVIFMIPFFVNVLYPLLGRAGLDLRPLRKICLGLFLASASFFTSAMIEALLLKGIRISILWQIPQYVIITVAEVLVNITGMEFAYSEAPIGMKSLIFSAWLMSNAIGNVLIILFSASNPLNYLEKASSRFYDQFLFGIIGAAASVLFLAVSRKFTYNK